jgi:hypothetical protein
VVLYPALHKASTLAVILTQYVTELLTVKNFFERQTNRTYILLSIGSLILTEGIFGFAWEGGYSKPVLAVRH